MTFTEAQLTAMIASFFWPMVRIGALFVAMPIFGNKQLSTKVKSLLTLMIALMLAPVLDPPPLVDVFSGDAVLIMFQQVIIGLIMGFSLHMVFGSLAVAGEMVGYQMKLGMAKMADPINGVPVPIVTTLYLTLAMLIILALDIHLVLIELLVDSFKVFPVAVDGLSPDSFWKLVGWGTRMFEIGLVMAMPIVGSILLLDVAQGYMQRAAQQFQIFAVGFPITLLGGMILIWVTLPAVLENFILAMDEILQFIRDELLVRK
jgi:flagellar biosynthetic protein FliR